MFRRLLYCCLVPLTIVFGSFAGGQEQGAMAALFDQVDVDQGKFIAIAVYLPKADRYNLLILEQISDSRLCWQDSDASKGSVEPLLLGFDFSGICGRSTDSNGYSIRQVGEDLALNYRLSVVKTGETLELVGLPNKPSDGPPLKIGHTQSLQGEYLKIELNQDWKFTRRAYQGKQLGHIYLTRDVLPPEPVLAEAAGEPKDQALATASDPQETVETNASTPDVSPDPSELEASSSGSSSALVAPLPTESASSTVQPLTGPIQIKVPLPPENPSDPALGPAFGPALGATSEATRLPLLQRPLPSLGAPAQSRILPSSPESPSPDPNNASQNLGEIAVLPVSSIAPLGRFGKDEPDIFSEGDLARLPQSIGGGSIDNPPPPPVALGLGLGLQRYRVFIDPNQDLKGQDIHNIVPDAFMGSYQGRRALQLGSFESKEKADDFLQQLKGQGIDGIIDAVQY